jgi:hypothetical protein
LPELSPESLRALIRAQLDRIDGWEDFQRTRVVVDPEAMIAGETRAPLDALPGMVRIRGDAVPIDYELTGGEGIARIRLREGQARRLRTDEVPPLDRPVRFAVQRGRHAPILADSVAELQTLLGRAPRDESEGDGGGRGPRTRGARRGPRSRGPGRRPRR